MRAMKMRVVLAFFLVPRLLVRRTKAHRKTNQVIKTNGEVVPVDITKTAKGIVLLTPSITAHTAKILNHEAVPIL
jgi:hypothetical protein